MRTVRTTSGGSVNVYGENEAPVAGEVNFSEREWAVATRIGKSAHDPDAQKEFWKTVMEKKMANESYSVLDDFPEVVEAKKYESEQARLADTYGHSIKEMLRSRGARMKAERNEGESA